MRLLRLAVCLALLIAPVAAFGGEVTGRQEVERCLERLQQDEEYLLDTPESRHRGEGYRAESAVRLCGLCAGTEISAGSSFSGVNVDILLRALKGKVKFHGNLMPLVSRIRKICERAAAHEGGTDETIDNSGRDGTGDGAGRSGAGGGAGSGDGEAAGPAAEKEGERGGAGQTGGTGSPR